MSIILIVNAYDICLDMNCMGHHRFKCILQIKTRKLKDEEKKKALETERTKEEQLSKKRRREERREKYRVQDKMKKKSRRDT